MQKIFSDTQRAGIIAISFFAGNLSGTSVVHVPHLLLTYSLFFCQLCAIHSLLVFRANYFCLGNLLAVLPKDHMSQLFHTV